MVKKEKHMVHKEKNMVHKENIVKNGKQLTSQRIVLSKLNMNMNMILNWKILTRIILRQDNTDGRAKNMVQEP
jgi:hypothetical protein